MTSKEDSLLEVAQIGRLVGLRGELKLHVHSDFPEQFKSGKTFKTDKNRILEILSYNQKRGLVLFRGYENRENAQILVNTYLFSSYKETEQNCNLNKDELFWFDVIGSVVQEDEKNLGFVEEIERIGIVDYMYIKTDKKLIDEGLPEVFYIPYIDRYVIETIKEKKVVHVKDGLALLENS